MKKLIVTIVSTFLFSIPVLAVCPLVGSCIPNNIGGNNSGIGTIEGGLQNKYMPNRINNLQQQDNFQQNQIKTYDGSQLNSPITFPEYTPNETSPQTLYNNCQFGMCLP